MKSTASIAGHPLHPAVVPFPIAFLSSAALTDVVHRLTGDGFWSQASFWLLAAGLVAGALAGLLGLIDFVTIARARQGADGWVHLIGNVLVLGISLVNVLLRRGGPAASVPPVGLVLSLLTAGILIVPAWFGGELAYRHKIGVAE